MKIVIDIDESTYHRFACGFANDDDAGLIERLFKSGTVLPKGHGRLIDADRLWEMYHATRFNLSNALSNVKTIIEADKED